MGKIRQSPGFRQREPAQLGMLVAEHDRLAAIRTDDTVALLDLGSGKEIKRLSGKSTLIDGGAFTPDGRTLIAWTSDGVVHLWNAMTGQELRHSVAARLWRPVQTKERGWDFDAGQFLKEASPGRNINYLAFWAGYKF